MAEDTDAEALVTHLLGSGKSLEAAEHAARAADEARAALAPHLAARLYALALEHGTFAPTERERLLVAQSAMHLRGFDSARAWPPLDEAARLGGPDGELHAMRATLIMSRLRLPESEVRIAAYEKRHGLTPRWDDLAQALDRLVERGLEFQERSEAEIPAEELRGLRLLTVDGYIARPQQSQPARAIQRLVRQLEGGYLPLIVIEAAQVVRNGAIFAPNHPMLAELFRWLEEHAGQVDNPDDDLIVAQARAQVHAWALGRPRVASEILESALARWEAHPDGRVGELQLATRERVLMVWDVCGQLGKLERAVPWTRDLENINHGDVTGALDLRRHVVTHLLAQDELDAARVVLDQLCKDPTRIARTTRFTRLILDGLLDDSRSRLEHYRQDLQEYDVAADPPGDQGWWSILGCGAYLHAAISTPPGPQRDAHLKSVSQCIARIEEVERQIGVHAFVFHRPWLENSRVGLAIMQGRRQDAIGIAEGLAVQRDPEVSPQPHHLALYHLGTVEGGPSGQAKIEEALGRLRTAGHVNPRRWITSHAPWLR